MRYLLVSSGQVQKFLSNELKKGGGSLSVYAVRGFIRDKFGFNPRFLKESLARDVPTEKLYPIIIVANGEAVEERVLDKFHPALFLVQ